MRVLLSLHKVKVSAMSSPPAPTSLKLGDLSGTLRNILIWQRSRRGHTESKKLSEMAGKLSFCLNYHFTALAFSCFRDTQPLKAPVHYSNLKSYFNLSFGWQQGWWKGKENKTYQTKVEIETVLVNSMFRLLFKYVFTYIKHLSLQKEKNKILFAMKPLPATLSS